MLLPGKERQDPPCRHAGRAGEIRALPREATTADLERTIPSEECRALRLGVAARPVRPAQFTLQFSERTTDEES